MMRVFLGLGSNLEDRRGALERARVLLNERGFCMSGASTILETEPLGGLDQPKYLNQVLLGETELSPRDFLMMAKGIERDMGRVDRERWASRIIDIDLLFYGDEILDEHELTVPHPRVLERSFVVSGILELAPDFVHPVLKKPLKALVAAA